MRDRLRRFVVHNELDVAIEVDWMPGAGGVVDDVGDEDAYLLEAGEEMVIME